MMKIKDIIYREDAIKAYRSTVAQYVPFLNGINMTLPLECETALKSVPSADRPQGEWIRDRYWSRGVGMGEEYGFFYKCSMCEYEVEDGYTRCGFNFCPYCGADMRKGVDDD